MGMFDTVIVPCPECGTEHDFQSKGGDCILATYTLDDAPADVLADVNRHSPRTCSKCGTVFDVDVVITTRPKPVSDIQRALLEALVEVPPVLLTSGWALTPRFFHPSELEVADMSVYDLTAERCRLVERYEEVIKESGGQETDKTRHVRECLDAVLERLRGIVSNIFAKGGQSK
jgi:hypothetical protein